MMGVPNDKIGFKRESSVPIKSNQRLPLQSDPGDEDLAANTRSGPGRASSMSKKKRIDTSKAADLSANPFGALESLRESLDPGTSQAVADTVASAPKAPRQPAPKRAVVRYSRAGRGGKEVTFIERLGLPPEQMKQWLRELKKVLGCGGYIEEDRLVVAGDQRDRLPGLLEERGVRKVSVS
jgi:translation initiation factor 1